jgi:hypothetical protein
MSSWIIFRWLSKRTQMAILQYRLSHAQGLLFELLSPWRAVR